MMRPSSKTLSWLLPLAVLAVATGLRFWQLGDVPYGIYPDEGVNGDDATGASLHWFYPRNYGREGLFVNLIAFATQLFGRTPFALRVTAAVFGVLCVVGVWLLGREAFRDPRVGLVAAWLTAVSFWAVNFSRLAFRGILLPAVLAFSFALLLRGVRTRSLALFAAAGALLGLALHTYSAARLAPFILPFLLAAWCITEPGFLRRHAKHLAAYALAALVVAGPMLLEFAGNREALVGRAEQVSIFSPAVNGGDLVGTGLRSAWLSLAKYFVIGDATWRHNYPPYPILFPAVSAAFLVGLAAAAGALIVRLRRRFGAAETGDPRLAAYTLLLAWFVVMLAAEFLTGEGLPHALRSIGTLPPVFLLAAWPLAWLLARAERFARPAARRSLIGAVVLVLLFTGVFNTVKYFGYWARDVRQAVEFCAPWRTIIEDMERHPDVLNKYVMLNAGGAVKEGELPLTACTFRYLMSPRIRNLHYVTGATRFRPPFVAAMLVRREDFLAEFRRLYPGGEVQYRLLEGFDNLGYWAFWYRGPSPPPR